MKLKTYKILKTMIVFNDGSWILEDPDFDVMEIDEEEVIGYGSVAITVQSRAGITGAEQALLEHTLKTENLI